MDAGGASCRSHAADALAERDPLAGADDHGVQMGETRLEASPVIYLDHVSIA
jgi:hypothetical protein